MIARALGSMKTSLVSKVTRKAAQLITPMGPTPYEFKELSDIDVQDGNLFQVPLIHVFQNKDEHFGGLPPTVRRDEPTRVIKEAVAKALVSYYPFAGRARETQGRKLVIECNGQGILFVEADADVTLKELGDANALLPPFPHELLYDVPGSTPILNTPLMLIQVTSLKCGGFILAVRYNHIMGDGQGILQFLNAVAELARGADTPSIHPIWERHIFMARDSPRVTSEHPAYDDEVVDLKGGTTIPLDDMAQKSFFFGPKEMVALRRFIPPNVKFSTFELLTACLWRCRTIALQPDPEEIFPFVCVISARRFVSNEYIPKGFYGNSFTYSGVQPTARELCSNSIVNALELVKKTKHDITTEHVNNSLADLMAPKDLSQFVTPRTFGVSDARRIRFDKLDVGWGPPVYGGIMKAGIGPLTGASSFYISYKNEKGVQGTLVPICLPDENAMGIFVKELNGLLSDNNPTLPIVASISSSL